MRTEYELPNRLGSKFHLPICNVNLSENAHPWIVFTCTKHNKSSIYVNGTAIKSKKSVKINKLAPFLNTVNVVLKCAKKRGNFLI